MNARPKNMSITRRLKTVLREQGLLIKIFLSATHTLPVLFWARFSLLNFAAPMSSAQSLFLGKLISYGLDERSWKMMTGGYYETR